MHYITIAAVAWLDVFTRRIYKDIITGSLAYCRKEKGLGLYGYVVMTNHIHLICRAKEGYELTDILRDFKRHTAKHIIKEIQENPRGAVVGNSSKGWFQKPNEQDISAMATR